MRNFEGEKLEKGEQFPTVAFFYFLGKKERKEKEERSRERRKKKQAAVEWRVAAAMIPGECERLQVSPFFLLAGRIWVTME